MSCEFSNRLGIFAQNTLHVLLSTFLGLDQGEQINQWSFVNDGVTQTVTDGDLLLRGNVPANMRPDWLQGFQQLLASQPPSAGTHWVRLYYAQINAHPIELELLLDNEPWTDVLPTRACRRGRPPIDS